MLLCRGSQRLVGAFRLSKSNHNSKIEPYFTNLELYLNASNHDTPSSKWKRLYCKNSANMMDTDGRTNRLPHTSLMHACNKG